MKVSVLASGSKGNALYVEGEEGALLVDSGLSMREVVRRIGIAGGDPSLISAVLVTHEHSDHVRGLGPLVRKFGMSVIAMEGTLSAILAGGLLGEGESLVKCRADESISHGGFEITPFSTQHDAADPCGFSLRENGTRLGCCTDTGAVNSHMKEHLFSCDALVFESNHCPVMLEEGPYPVYLKRRISDAQRGHLSNNAAAACLREMADDLSTVVLAHLSEVNNTPEKALLVSREAMGVFGDDIMLGVAGQKTVFGPFEV